MLGSCGSAFLKVSSVYARYSDLVSSGPRVTGVLVVYSADWSAKALPVHLRSQDQRREVAGPPAAWDQQPCWMLLVVPCPECSLTQGVLPARACFCQRARSSTPSLAPGCSRCG